MLVQIHVDRKGPILKRCLFVENQWQLKFVSLKYKPLCDVHHNSTISEHLKRRFKNLVKKIIKGYIQVRTASPWKNRGRLFLMESSPSCLTRHNAMLCSSCELVLRHPDLHDDFFLPSSRTSCLS